MSGVGCWVWQYAFVMDGYEYEEEDDDAFVEHLIAEGILVEDGFTDDGEITYSYNFELMKVMMPELYEEIMSGITNNLMHLYELGFVEVDYDENLQAHFRATEDGKEFFNGLGY